MMMRSAPADSAHLAEIPVPAPAPTMGLPAALLSRHRFRLAARSIAPLLPLCQLGSQIHSKSTDTPLNKGILGGKSGAGRDSLASQVHNRPILFAFAQGFFGEICKSAWARTQRPPLALIIFTTSDRGA